MSEEDFTRLIRHHTVASVDYSQDSSDREHDQPLPLGLERHDVYIIKQAPFKPVAEKVSLDDIE